MSKGDVVSGLRYALCDLVLGHDGLIVEELLVLVLKLLLCREDVLERFLYLVDLLLLRVKAA